VQGVDLPHLERSRKCPIIAERLHSFGALPDTVFSGASVWKHPLLPLSEERAIAMASFSVRFGTGAAGAAGAAGASGAELQPIARPATNSINVMAIVRTFMGDILHN